MRIFIALLFLLLSTAAQALGGSYYNPERDGEGVNVFIRGRTLNFMFFTYYDRSVAVAPVPSPAPPAPPEIGCANEAVWYLGVADNWDGEVATGRLYLARPLDYPNVAVRINGTDGLQEMEAVGTFTMNPDTEGFDLTVKSTGLLPPGMYLFNNRFSFNKVIIQ